MNTLIHCILVLAAAALLATVPSLSRAERVARPVADYTVFVDPPTGFVFVKLPEGWKFVGKVADDQLDKLPAGVVTALLSEEHDDAGASHLALQRAR